MVTTWRTSVSSFTVLVLGTSTSIPDCRIGAVIMKIIRSTSTTSMKGTMLMSASVVSVPRCVCGMACLEALLFNSSILIRAVNRFNLADELRRQIVHSRGYAADAGKIVVVSDHGGNCGEQARC